MIFTAVWVDVTEGLRTQRQPRYMLSRPKAGGRDRVGDLQVSTISSPGLVGEFWVPRTPLNADVIEWAIVSQGDVVPIPVVAYDAPLPSSALVLALGVEYGMRAMASLLARHPRPPTEVTLVLGNNVDSVQGADGVTGYRCYVGLAARVA